ncbi:MAG: EamA family transporter [Spirochaetales bacterium]|nr:EamA family transporter [Spirochaetales bacterium]MBR6199837.1 EamA family transporter [Spirochaetales bacterium]
MLNLFLLILSALFGAVGQIFLKKSAAACAGQDGVLQYFISLLCNGSAWIGAVSYFVSLGLYMVALSRTELSAARSVSAFSYVLVIVLSYFIFGDTFTPFKIAGIVCISVGVFLLSLSM